ncbi:MAG: FAD-dependent oxidoreductase [Phycisphaeraceae bacterium]
MAVVRPASTEQVQRIVDFARERGLALHPISRGCNWGYGDARAPTAGQVILDLSRMNRIVELNRRLGYVVIEAGVTQGQLWEHLQTHAPQLWMDSTGAGPDASLVGNALDRGFGHTRYGDHTLTACGMEIVLADGRVLNTGYGHYDDAVAHRVYRYGVGPSLDGLFAQSNVGIVTRIGLWLTPVPEAFSAFFFSSPDAEALEDLIERLAPLRMNGLLQSAIHIGNDLRLLSARTRYPWDRAAGRTPLPDELRRELCAEFRIDAWTGCGTVTGTPAIVRATVRAVRRALKPHRVVFINDRRIALAHRVAGALDRFGAGARLRQQLATVDPLYRLLKGEPTRESLYGTLWRVRGELPGPVTNPLDAHAGIMWSSPVLPMTGSDARRLLSLIEPIYARHGFEAMVTFTMISERAMIAVTNLYFDTRESDEAQRAAACYDELGQTLMDHGYVPYRVGPSGTDRLRRGSAVFWDVVAQLKQTLDPHGVISPGRYEPRP